VRASVLVDAFRVKCFEINGLCPANRKSLQELLGPIVGLSCLLGLLEDLFSVEESFLVEGALI